MAKAKGLEKGSRGAPEQGQEGQETPPGYDFDDDFNAGWDEGAVASAPPDDPIQNGPDPENDPDEAVASAAEGQPPGEVPSGAAAAPAPDVSHEPEGLPPDEEDEDPVDTAGEDEPPEEGEPPPAAAAPAPAGGEGAAPQPSDSEKEIAQLRRQLHNQQSEIGRLRGFVRDRDQHIEAITKNPPRPAGPPADTSHLYGEEADQKITRWQQEVDPEGAEAANIMVGRVEARAAERERRLNSRIDELEGRFADDRRTRQVAETRTEGVTLLNEHFGGDHWYEEYQNGRLAQWVQDQSPGMQAMFESNDPRDTLALYDIYYTRNPERLPQREPDPPTPRPGGNGRTNGNGAAAPAPAPSPREAARRTRQRRGAGVAPASGGGSAQTRRPAPASAQDEFDQGWEEGALS